MIKLSFMIVVMGRQQAPQKCEAQNVWIFNN